MTKTFEYCPLCSAHEFEWGEGDSSDNTILRFKEQIEILHQKLQQIEKGEKKDEQPS